jgi:hypothetical protein
LLCLVANDRQLSLHAVLDGQVDLAFGVVEVALLADKVGLSPLGFGQLGVSLPEYFIEVGDFLCPRLQIGLDKALGLQRLGTTAILPRS